MTYTIRLPFEDHDGTLSPLVNDAIKTGATADRGRENGTDTFDLTFATKAKATAFKAKLGANIVATDVEGAADPEPVVEVLPEQETPASE